MTEATEQGMHVLAEDDYWQLGFDVSRKLALLRRSAMAFPELGTMHAANDRVVAAFARCLAEGIVVDMRLAPPNNDPNFEKAMRGLRDAMARSFRRVVLLVVSAAGELQMSRIHTQDRNGFLVTRDYAKAWKLAAGG